MSARLQGEPFLYNMETETKKEAWWKPAVEIASLISSWIIAPIVLALVGGKWLDTHFSTTPIIFLSLAGIGFIISSFGIVRTVLKYIRQIEKLGEKQNDNTTNSKY